MRDVGGVVRPLSQNAIIVEEQAIVPLASTLCQIIMNKRIMLIVTIEIIFRDKIISRLLWISEVQFGKPNKKSLKNAFDRSRQFIFHECN